MSMKGWAKAHRYPGGITKYLYDKVNSNSTGDTALAERVETLEKIVSVDVSFTVEDDQGTPEAVQGATVSIDGKTGTTGSSGGCSIKTILPGKYTVTVEKTGFTTYSAEITVDSTHTSFNITLTSAS